MPTINREQLEVMLRGQSRPTPVTIVSRTEPDLLKKNRDTGEPNPYLGCVKLSRVNGFISWSYESCVNRQRVREGQPTDNEGTIEYFEAAPRRWGYRVRGTPLVEYKGSAYLELKVERSLGHQYLTVEGAEIPAEALRPFLPKRKEGERQEVDRPVICRDYRLDHIEAITFGGEYYEVRD